MDETIKPVVKRNRNTDIILKLEVIDGKRPLSAAGLVDTRLFTGENTLHAKLDPQTCLWRLEYTSGILPVPLKQKFTDFTRLLNFVTDYLKRRNIKIAEIQD